VDVLPPELAVPGRGPLRVDQPLAFQESDLRDGHVRVLGLDRDQDLADGHVVARRHRSLPHEEGQLELPDLQLVAVGELRLLDPLPVHVRPVQAPDVVDEELAVLAPELRVAPGDGDVVQEDVALRMPAGRGHVLVDQELRPRVRTSLHDEQGLAGLEVALRQRRDLAGLVLEARSEADGRVFLKRSPTVRAEVRVRGISMSTVATEHSRLPLYLLPTTRARLRPGAGRTLLEGSTTGQGWAHPGVLTWADAIGGSIVECPQMSVTPAASSRRRIGTPRRPSTRRGTRPRPVRSGSSSRPRTGSRSRAAG